MCGIAGFVNYRRNYLSDRGKYEHILMKMCQVLYHRGPDESGRVLRENYGLAHTRLSIIDLKNGKQPMSLKVGDNTFSIVYNGEIYNTSELRNDLISKGWSFETTSDTEVILVTFAEYGSDAFKMLNGIFAFMVVNDKSKETYLVRDQVGVKPLYYSIRDGEVIFASEIKGMFEYEGIRPEIDTEGLNEVLSLGPAKTYGKGVFKNILEVKPGHFIRINKEEIQEHKYWGLEAEYHTLSYDETVEKTRFLVSDSIKRQMISDVPIATFLSGGIDSSIVSAICSDELKKKGEVLGTFSFDFVDNDKYFKANSFQPSQDKPFVKIMVDYMQSDHHYLECNNSNLYDKLYESVDVRDLPTMADVDSSMLYFCSQVKPYYKVVLTGECADEIFGGYPWFHKKECFEADTFPWSMDITARQSVLKDEVIRELRMDEYIRNAYENTINETPALDDEDKTEARRRQISYLNIKWFMQTLLDRMDRASMCSGLEARVPFADTRIMQFMYNVPWKMKSENGVEKSLLRNAMKGLLPDEVLFRKKSPYPKTYDPHYEKLLAGNLIEVIEDTSSPVNRLVDKNKVYAFINEKKDYGKPWYGQLMAGPQMLAYLLQINYWLRKFNL